MGDGTTYRYTGQGDPHTGLPRFDRLLAKARGRPRRPRPGPRRADVAAWLTSTTRRPDFERPSSTTGSWSPRYLQEWMAILRSPGIADAAAAAGRRIGFMPHPIMQPCWRARPARACRAPDVRGQRRPGPVRPLRPARDRLLVGRLQRRATWTARSSTSSSTATSSWPAQHIGRAGYFDYERDGFGPVVTTAEAAIEAIVASSSTAPAHAIVPGADRPDLPGARRTRLRARRRRGGGAQPPVPVAERRPGAARRRGVAGCLTARGSRS